MALSTRIQRHAAPLALMAACLAAAVGALFFFMAMRPCRIDLNPGTEISYQLSTSVVPVDEDGQALGDPVLSQRGITLLGLGEERTVAMLSAGEPGQRDEVALLRYDVDGRARRYADDLTLLDEGKALRFFDLNLLPLPEGLEQHWNTSVVYAALPPGRRLVQVRVRRIESGLTSVFEMRPTSAIQWPEEHPDGSRYRRVGDLVARYRFNGAEGFIDAAEIRFEVGSETADGRVRRHRVEMRLEGRRVDHGGDTAALTHLAYATLEAQTALEDGRPERLRPLLAELHAAGAVHPRLRELADRLAREAGGQLPEAPGSGWVVHVASYQPRHRDLADRLARELVADGYPAFTMLRGDYLTVCVGPYANRDERIQQRLEARFPDDRPFWRRVD